MVCQSTTLNCLLKIIGLQKLHSIHNTSYDTFIYNNKNEVPNSLARTS